ncbi:MAG: O-antigen ligase family protein [Oscillospiraceae bacterium]
MKEARWLTDKYICLMLLVFPVWTGFHGYAALTLSKFAFFAGATLLWLLALAVCLVWRRPALKKPTAPQLCCMAFAAAACLSAALSPFGSETLLGASRWDGLLTLLLYALIFLAISAFGEVKPYYVNLLAVSATVCSCIAILQLSDVNAAWLFPDGLSYYDSGILYSGAFLGTIGNTDLLAAFFSLCIPVFVASAFFAKESRAKLLLLPAALCLYVLLRSGVASGALALPLAALICVPYYVNHRFKRRRLTALFIALSAALVIAGLLVVYNWQGESGSVWELSRVLHGDLRDSFGSSRIRIWRESLMLIRERPLLGGGPDTLSLRSAVDFSRYVPESGLTLSVHVDNAHNEFLNYLVNIGLLGFLPYLALCCLSLARWLRGAAPALGCGLLCYFIQSFFGLGLCIVVPLVWIFMGLLSAPSPSEASAGTCPAPNTI